MKEREKESQERSAGDWWYKNIKTPSLFAKDNLTLSERGKNLSIPFVEFNN